MHKLLKPKTLKLLATLLLLVGVAGIVLSPIVIGEPANLTLLFVLPALIMGTLIAGTFGWVMYLDSQDAALRMDETLKDMESTLDSLNISMEGMMQDELELERKIRRAKQGGPFHRANNRYDDGA